MSSVKYPLVGGRSMRATREDSCGRPLFGNRAQIATDGFVSVAVTANYDDGEEVSVTNARGRKCVQRDAEAELINLSVDATFCQVDPEFYTAFTGFPQILDPATGNVIGFAVDRSIRPGDVRNGLEVWADAMGSTGCEDKGDEQFGYLLWPQLSGGRVGDYTIENNAVTFSVTGMTTKDGTGWGQGPYNVVTDAGGEPSPLIDAPTATQHQIVLRTSVAPPEPTIGLIPLDDPDQPDATGATAGSPGAFTPAGAVRPYNFEALDTGSITATPSTAWTTGQYVILGDGSYANWDGSTNGWAEGKG